MKKLLGLLAVAPMALAACGPAAEAEIKYDATAYGTTHGYTIYGDDNSNNTVTVAVDKVITLAALGQADGTVCDSIDMTDAALVDATMNAVLGKKFSADNGYTITATTAVTLVDVAGEEECSVATEGTYDVQASLDTMTQTGLTRVDVKLDSDNKVTNIKIDETSGNTFKETFVRENDSNANGVHEDELGFRLLAPIAATTWVDAQTDLTWKRDNLGYMPGEDGEGKWNPTMDALVKFFDGIDLAAAEALLTDADFIAGAGWADSSVTGASEELSDRTQYAKVIVEAIRLATEANAAE